jgi:murein DD-endopeptidase MepM/ murein hydrolase activator NlpD
VFTVESSPQSALLQPAGYAILPSYEVPNLPGAAALPPLLGIPPAVPEVRSYAQLLDLWQRAGAAYGVPWQILAAINRIESDFGRNMGPSSAGALGWMQFMPSTWEMWGTDANGDGVADPWNPEDAVYSAARYLAAAGAQEDLYRAVYAYNQADWYVNDVLELASSATVAGMAFPLPAGASWTRGGGPDAHRAGGRGDNWQSLNAVDIVAAPGTPVLAVFAGIVSDVTEYEPPHVSESGAVVSGGSVSLMSFDGTEVFYTHLDSLSVVIGQAVAAGQAIAAVASDTPGGPHLHFALESPLNPEAIFGDSAFGAPLLTPGFGLERVFARADLHEQLAQAWRQVRLARLALAHVDEELERQEAESRTVEGVAGDPALSLARFRELEAKIADLAAAQERMRGRLARRQRALAMAFARLERLRSEASIVSFTRLVSNAAVARAVDATPVSRTLASAAAPAPTGAQVFTVLRRAADQPEVVGFTR